MAQRNYGGSPELVRLNVLQFARGPGRLDEMKAMVQACMDEYDVDGWTDGIWT